MRSTILLAAATSASAFTVDPAVLDSLHDAGKTQGQADIFVKLPDFGRDLTFTQSLSKAAPALKKAAVYAHLKGGADRAQAPLLEALKNVVDSSSSVRPLWITNAVFVKGASAEVVELASQFGDVALNTVRATLPVTKPDAGTGKAVSRNGGRAAEAQWNLVKIGAPAAWNVTRGEGVVVASIDSGVQHTHEALVGSYRGNNGDGTFTHDYNWYDPLEYQNDDFWCPGPQECELNGKEPFDVSAHGTHTTATIVGSEESGVGVAPGAKWIAAKGCRDGGACLDFGLLTSAEFVMCPWQINDPSTADCSQGADIVSNSWGGYAGDMFYVDATAAWRAAGIVPVFAAGNSGPRCGTVSSPGDYPDVIAVASTDSDDALSSFSSRGEGVVSLAKPDISAPGENILSAIGGFKGTPAGDGSLYQEYSGTSMATPHITGGLALVLSVDRSLSYDEALATLVGTVDDAPRAPPNNGALGNDECGGIEYTAAYSYHYGHGRLDVAKAVLQAAKMKQTKTAVAVDAQL